MLFTDHNGSFRIYRGWDTIIVHMGVIHVTLGKIVPGYYREANSTNSKNRPLPSEVLQLTMHETPEELEAEWSRQKKQQQVMDLFV